MVTSSILYKHMKKWVRKGDKYEDWRWQNSLVFYNNKVYATNAHSLVVVKEYPSTDPHFETSDGAIKTPSNLQKSVQKYIQEDIVPKIGLVIPPPSKFQYSTIISSVWFPHMKNAFDFIKKASKKSHQTSYKGVCMLNFHDGKLYVMGAGEYYGAKFLLSNNLEKGTPWYGYFNAEYLENAIDFIVDTKSPTHSGAQKL